MENQFNVGDLVWAKVGRHPWWPSIIYNEALTSAGARQAKKKGCVLISFFGDNSYKWIDPKKLFDFESNYSMYSNRSRSRLFVEAINDAVYEVIHRAAIGMTCPCVFFASYRPSPVEGFLKVDLAGYQPGGVYSVKQIEQFRQEFRPVETLSFVQQLALDPTNVPQDINSSKEIARVLAFRKARYAEVDEPYFLAFGVMTPIRPGDPVVASNNKDMTLFQVPTYTNNNGQSCSTFIIVLCLLFLTFLQQPNASLIRLVVYFTDPSEAEIPGQKKPKVKSQNKTKRRLVRLNDKVHAAKEKRTVKRYRRHDSNTASSQDHVPQNKRQAKFEVEKKLDVTSDSNGKKQISPSPFKEPSMSNSKDNKEVKSLSTTTKSGDVHFVEKVRSSDTSMPSKTERTRKDSPAVSNKRQRSEDREMALASPPIKKRKKGEISRIVKEPQEGAKTTLSMKFPPDTALPSSSELKAKFARFGLIETSGIRVSWMKSRCQVVFMNKSDAENAYDHAVKSKEMFGQTKVNYRLHTQVSTPGLLEGGIPGANAGSDLKQEETPVTPPS
ncbi:hypothetical protein L6452_16845 [Arctium lappa]|uniref:Uncharacterized protein n=1 Tax=Arctium lappa TaxID=4217 RepID=A0ACB9C1U4_ARCLA|nr:hypothetical protein L6452_16845 [Arctium lappa]